MPLRPTFAEIDLDALRHNFRLLRRQAGAGRQLLAVVKADAYGHGALPVARTLQACGADYFGVAMVAEGTALRQGGIQRPILVLGGAAPGEEALLLDQNLTPVIFDLPAARRLSAAAMAAGRSCRYHLKVDSGMGRLGFVPADLPAVLPRLADLPGLEMAGLISHFALADQADHPITQTQAERFRAMLGTVRAAGFAPALVHLSNSAGLYGPALPDCNLVRPGIALYGGLPADYLAGEIDLRPVMRLYTTIAQLTAVPPGAGVSYGHRFVASRPTLIAALPVGYADGYARRLSGCGEVLVRGHRAPVAGTVCMDWTMVDVTDVPAVAVGDRVTLLGRDGSEEVTAEEWAGRIGTISYEVFCLISQRVPRVYLNPEPGPA
ncbi:alanine racemase [Desulfuromonas carbonis]|uniref:alanine racemase n=1 Tax=Desulfuromonas sp. DDH964 TaxID=1823759 RepID=UPI00078C10C4|nr:alanine racemase [Desulfuromonas sp. DDH964]AMV73168.1 alanine racemase [Desulfuromonas sp. DDH964]